jgi:stage V sporulation protein K
VASVVGTGSAAATLPLRGSKRARATERTQLNLRDRVLDEARAIASGNQHPEIEPRHVLWGLVRALGGDAPREVPLARVKLLMAPPGTFKGSPAVSVEAQKIVDGIESVAAAQAATIDLAARLLANVPEFAAPVEATAVAGQRGAAAGSIVSATPDTTAGVLAELDALVGLGTVKSAVRRLIAVQSLNAERRAAGLPEVNASLHIVFTGNPGTGKTTVARLIARLYKTIGVVSKGQLIEATRADLVAGYVGQTALKVQEVVRRAFGGVLFIDEAYSLAPEGSWDFGAEAIAMLVQMMEAHRRDLAVIAAGYPEEMRRFIDSNPGLRSRFTNYIDFPDYSTSELVLIFELMAAQAQVKLGVGIPEQLKKLFTEAGDVGNFGNARYARSIFEQAYANMASRALADGKIEPSEIEDLAAADLPGTVEHSLTEHRKIGFRAP